jgi:deazaflavin-dependent oxidoreductase (nitroreductase family)
MAEQANHFQKPGAGGQFFNRFYGFLVGLGIGFSYSFLLEVRGRKSGRIYSTPISLLELDGKRYLVAPRGITQWVRNAEAAGEVTLKRGASRRNFRLRALSDAEKPPVLKEYLDRYKAAVQRFFSVKAGSPVEAFAAVAQNYPAFELLSLGVEKAA